MQAVLYFANCYLLLKKDLQKSKNEVSDFFWNHDITKLCKGVTSITSHWLWKKIQFKVLTYVTLKSLLSLAKLLWFWKKGCFANHGFGLDTISKWSQSYYSLWHFFVKVKVRKFFLTFQLFHNEFWKLIYLHIYLLFIFNFN